MSTASRLFVAICLPEEVRRAVENRLAPLRRGLPPARWVPTQNLHVTLAFLGNVASTAVGDLEAGLREAVAAQPAFDAVLGAGGTFPPGRPARVAWIALDADPDVLDLLQAAVIEGVALGLGEEAVGELRRERAERGFHPHLTVARADPPWKWEAVDRYLAACPAGALGDRFRVGSVSLMASELGGGPPRYREVAACPLATDGAHTGGGGAP